MQVKEKLEQARKLVQDTKKPLCVRIVVSEANHNLW